MPGIFGTDALVDALTYHIVMMMREVGRGEGDATREEQPRLLTCKSARTFGSPLQVTRVTGSHAKMHPHHAIAVHIRLSRFQGGRMLSCRERIKSFAPLTLDSCALLFAASKRLDSGAASFKARFSRSR